MTSRNKSPHHFFDRFGLTLVFVTLVTALGLDYGNKKFFVINLIATVITFSLVAYKFINLVKLPRSLTLLSLFTIWLVFTAIWSNNLSALQLAVPYLIGLTLSWLTYFSIKHKNDFNYFICVYIMVALGVAAVSFQTIYGDRIYFGKLLPNQVSTIISLGIVASIYMASKFRDKAAKWVFIITALYLSYSLIRTGSRGGIAGLLLSVIFFLTIKYRKSYKQLLNHKLILAGVIIFIGLMISTGVTKQLNRASYDNAHDRIIYARSAIGLFKQKPVFGSGIGTYQTEGLSKQRNVQSLTRNAHASLLQLLAETGIVGVTLLVLAIYSLTKGVFKSKLQLVHLLWLMLLIYCVQASVDLHLEYQSIIFLFYMIFGATAAGINHNSTDYKNHKLAETKA